jgi:tRNA dimethylallyltransferase
VLNNDLLIILGPTASGKTKLAVNLANELGAEIISADSRQIFKGMDIGTGKDLDEYLINSNQIPFHLIDIKDAGEKYNVNLFKEDFYKSLQSIRVNHSLPILCGGTGMYIHSILQNHELTAVPIDETLRAELVRHSKDFLVHQLSSYPENLRKNVDYSSSKRLIRAIEIAEYFKKNDFIKLDRPIINPFVIGLKSEVEIRRKKILDRLETRLNTGLIEEVEGLIANGIGIDILNFYGLEYKFIAAYLTNQIDLQTLKERLGTAICQYAKRQMTFFRKMEKDGVKINWLNANDEFLKDNALQLIKNNFQLK